MLRLFDKYFRHIFRFSAPSHLEALLVIDFDINNPDNTGLVTMTKQFLAMSALFQIIEAARIAYFGSLRALKDTKFTMLTSILSFWCIALPIGYILAMILHMGGVGYWCGILVGDGDGCWI
jgi:multidrug resistance protein, MATE family